MPAPAFGILPHNAGARRAWRHLPFPLAEYERPLARMGAPIRPGASEADLAAACVAAMFAATTHNLCGPSPVVGLGARRVSVPPSPPGGGAR